MVKQKTPSKIRCAIYTRKSTEEGLEQEFNSLDAQYEACAAYIASQKHEGWKLVDKRPARRANQSERESLPNIYADGGISGGTMERAGLQALLADIDAGLIDMIVVYKIDRLTRSLSDFSKIVDRLDARGASFVSVTQSFNTATSLGRLTLNMLLSFSQFEREVTAERIRDKIAASKAKGLWMGGTVPLGYDPNPDKNVRGLVINPAEVKSIKRIFELYDEFGNLSVVNKACEQEGIRSKFRPQYQSRLRGGSVMTNGQIHHILTNPLYIGKIKHKDQIYDGQHEAIIELGLWDRVQADLQSASARKRGQVKDPNKDYHAWLIGKMYDETGDRLTPTHTKPRGKILRYYISNRLIKVKDPSGWRLPAKDIEKAVQDSVLTHIQSHAFLAQIKSATPAQINGLRLRIDQIDTQITDQMLAKLVDRIDIQQGEIAIKIGRIKLERLIKIAEGSIDDAALIITQPLHIRKRGVEGKIIIGEMVSQPDPKLQVLLARAHHWATGIKAGKTIKEIAEQEKADPAYIRTRLPLAFLSPKIQIMIFEGKQPPEWSIRYFLKHDMMMGWNEQEALFLKS